MKIRMNHLILNNIPLAFISFILGFSFWYIATYDTFITLQVTIPLYFSEFSEKFSLHAPETISVTFSGKRSDVYAIDQENLAAYIDLSKLLPGKHSILLKEEHLFLPPCITLLHYKPTNLSVVITENRNIS